MSDVRKQDLNLDEQELHNTKVAEADAVGEQAVGGTAPTPDMDMVDELGAAVGLEMDDRAYLHTQEILEGRDNHRWDLDPASAEDYGER